MAPINTSMDTISMMIRKTSDPMAWPEPGPKLRQELYSPMPYGDEKKTITRLNTTEAVAIINALAMISTPEKM
jgi:hypothetical protein